LAFERLNIEPFDVTNIIKDVLNEFKDVSENDITQAIKKGSLGYYGKTYRFSTQEVMLWIMEYLKNKPLEHAPPGVKVVTTSTYKGMVFSYEHPVTGKRVKCLKPLK